MQNKNNENKELIMNIENKVKHKDATSIDYNTNSKNKKISDNGRYSFGSGQDNPKGLHLVNSYIDDRAHMEFEVLEEYTGHPGLLHGGITCVILDEVMYFAALTLGETAVTVHLSVDYKKPGLLGHTVVAESWVVWHEGRKIELEAELRDAQSGDLLAIGHGIYYVTDVKKLAEQ